MSKTKTKSTKSHVGIDPQVAYVDAVPIADEDVLGYAVALVLGTPEGHPLGPIKTTILGYIERAGEVLTEADACEELRERSRDDFDQWEVLNVLTVVVPKPGK